MRSAPACFINDHFRSCTQRGHGRRPTHAHLTHTHLVPRHHGHSFQDDASIILHYVYIVNRLIVNINFRQKGRHKHHHAKAVKIPVNFTLFRREHPMNTPVNTRCSKWRDHPMNTHPAHTRRMKQEARKLSIINVCRHVNTQHLFFVNFTA